MKKCTHTMVRKCSPKVEGDSSYTRPPFLICVKCGAMKHSTVKYRNHKEVIGLSVWTESLELEWINNDPTFPEGSCFSLDTGIVKFSDISESYLQEEIASILLERKKWDEKYRKNRVRSIRQDEI